MNVSVISVVVYKSADTSRMRFNFSSEIIPFPSGRKANVVIMVSAQERSLC